MLLYIGIEISKTSNIIRRCFGRNTFKKRMEKATGKNGWIIGYLAQNQEKEIFQRDIETEFSMRRSTVSNMIKLMEQKGYIARESVPGDARLKRLVLTEKSMDTYAHMMEEIHHSEEQMRKGISEEELSVFFHVMEMIQRNLQEGGDTT